MGVSCGLSNKVRKSNLTLLINQCVVELRFLATLKNLTQPTFLGGHISV